MAPFVPTMLPLLTADLPGIGGVLKQRPEDFLVEEIPLYEPSGEGEHLFLWIEKRDVSAESLMQHLAATLGIGRGDIGVAGLKDRRAVTRQYVSVRHCRFVQNAPASGGRQPRDGRIRGLTSPARQEPLTSKPPGAGPARRESRVGDIDSDSITVLKCARHGNKLKTGHLKGNRFEIVVRDPCDGAEARAAPIAEVIKRHGFPNYYGRQRFGHEGETLSLGLDLLTGRRTQRDIPRNRRKFLVRLSLSAVQSAIFNEVLSRRISDGLLHRVLPGDVMQVRSSGGPFVVEDVAREQQRFEQGETVISGPMFGVKMRQPAGEAAERERAALESFGLTPAHFAARRKLLPGTRRPLIAFADDWHIESGPEGIRFRFALARGVYATSLLREFTKDVGPAEEMIR